MSLTPLAADQRELEEARGATLPPAIIQWNRGLSSALEPRAKLHDITVRDKTSLRASWIGGAETPTEWSWDERGEARRANGARGRVRERDEQLPLVRMEATRQPKASNRSITTNFNTPSYLPYHRNPYITP